MKQIDIDIIELLNNLNFDIFADSKLMSNQTCYIDTSCDIKIWNRLCFDGRYFLYRIKSLIYDQIKELNL